jgi:hypothetical protein
MRRSSSLFFIAIAFAVFGACAQGTEGSGDDGSGDDVASPDANDDLPIDSSVPIDSSTPIDANIPIDSSLPIDAPVPIDAGGGGLICTSSTQCTEAGTCCFQLDQSAPGFCVPGTEIAGVCFPV